VPDWRCITDGIVLVAEWLPVAGVVTLGAVAGGVRALRRYRKGEAFDRVTQPDDTCSCGHTADNTAGCACSCGDRESDHAGRTPHKGHGPGES